jgi:hypothetical protein
VTEETPEQDIRETEAFFETVSNLPPDIGYTENDRFRDFRMVFLGSEEGKRVLRSLLGWGHMFKTSMPAGPAADPLRLAFSEGERNLALRIVTTINVEPANKPNATKRSKGD